MDCQDNPNCQEAADRAVKKVFAILGVDVDKPESVENFREDLRFGRKLRKAADHGFLALGLSWLQWAQLSGPGSYPRSMVVTDVAKIL
jgi:hypothetical protein